MNFIDMRTLILNQALSYAVCTVLIALLWQQNRQRFAGLDFWLAALVMQTMSMVLFILRGIIPPWASIIIGNALLLAGTILLYIGLEHLTGQRSKQIHNGVLLVIIVTFHSYFTLVQPNLAIRNINISIGLLLISLQIAWLMLWRVDAEMRSMTRETGFVFAVYALVSIIRIVANITIPSGNDFFKQSGLFDTILLLAYQILVFAAMFSLFFMLNRRLFADLQTQQAAVYESEARYRQVVELSPDAIVIHQEGNIVFVNSATVALSGATSQDDLLGKTIFEFIHPDYHKLAQERIEQALNKGSVPFIEEKLIRLDGKIIDIEATSAKLEYKGKLAFQTVIHDITMRKEVEKTVQLRLELFEFAANHTLHELMRYALDEIGELTNSPIGFYHFVEEDQKMLSLQAWSTRTLQEFCQAEGAGMHYDIDQAGVWVDCIQQRKAVIHNDYASLSHRKGLPPGHAEIKRELVVPTMREGRIVSILGIGNKSSEYDDKDIELVTYVADVIWSIVERKRTEAQLQNYQHQLEVQNLELRKLSLAIEQSGNIIVITDTSGAIQYANPRFEQTTGYTIDEALGQNPRILKSGEQGANFYQTLWNTIKNGQIWRGEFHNRRKDGSLYWESATITPVHDPSGQITDYIAIKEDITERKRMEQAAHAQERALQESEERMRTLIENLPIEFWAKGVDGKYIMQNSAMRKLIGDNAGLTLEEIEVDKTLREKWQEEDQRVLSGETVHSEHKIWRHGQQRIYQQIVAPVQVDESPVAMLGIMMDITDQRRMEASLLQAIEAAETARREAEAANRAKSRFFANMSHELRTPLNAVLGFSELMAHDPNLTQTQRTNLDIIGRSGEHLLALINDALDLSKIEAARMELQPQIFDLHKMLLGLGEMFRLRADQKELTVVFDFAPDVPQYILADAGKLRQVLTNLLGNAMKFTEQGSVVLRVSVKDQLSPDDKV